MNQREKELQERQDKRILRWGKQQGIIRQRRLAGTNIVRIIYEDGRKEEIDFTDFIAKGWVDLVTLELTEAGELEKVQLETLKWMAEHPRKKKERK